VTTPPSEDYYEEPDGFGMPTIWVANQEHPDLPVPVLSKKGVAEGFWPDVVARMTGTTITNDATPEDLDEAIAAHISGEEELTVEAVADLISRREDLTGDLHLDATAQRARDFARTPYDYPGEGDGYPPPGTTITTDDATVERLGAALAERFYNQTIDTAAIPENWKRWDDLSDATKAKETHLKSNLARFVLAALTGLPHD
jgi:hypothetical protein